MNDIQIFNNEEFGQVRTIEIHGKPYFSAKDVAEALGYSNPRKAILDHCKGVTKRDTLTAGGQQSVNFIPEGDIYRLIVRSNLPSAERFEKWVFDEVIPQIRQTGGYQLPQTYAEALRALADKAEQNEKLTARIETMRPKEIFADAVAASRTSILIGELAKLITQNGYEIGQKRLFSWMREHGYLMKYGESVNMPTQRYVQQGLFEIKESSVQNADGSVRITKTTKVTGKGQQYFINKFLSVPFPE
ncbi:MAG: phage antirepressor KilAC domain-containing protein [Clostridia bacterium]|nr:phage antirepressor KilAC domain-containing protein [Clostridia bacterium]